MHFPSLCRSVSIFVIVYASVIVLIPIVVIVYFNPAVRIASFMCFEQLQGGHLRGGVTTAVAALCTFRRCVVAFVFSSAVRIASFMCFDQLQGCHPRGGPLLQ